MKSLNVTLVLLAILATGIFFAGCTTGSPQTTPQLSAPATPVPAITGSVPIAPADYPKMVGIWKSNDGSVYLLNDAVRMVPAGENTWVFTSQNDHGVTGFKTFSMPGGAKVNETLVGIFDPDGKTLTFIDQPGGLAKGSLIDSDTLFVALTNPGNKTTGAMAISLTLHRQKTP